MNNLLANWPAPPHVQALTTQRTPGFSAPPFHENNLAFHVNDNPQHVQANREQLTTWCALPNEPEWLEQTHSTVCVVVEEESNRIADAAITREPHRVLAIMTADCQPILLCDQSGTEIAAIHAGWKGLADGIIENTLRQMQSPHSELLAWIGPTICQSCFEVGDEVRELFVNRYPFSKTAFKPHRKKWLADLGMITHNILREWTVSHTYSANKCTFECKNEYYSYRREQQTGRMATLIWFNQ